MTPDQYTGTGLIVGALLILAGVVVIHLAAYGRERRRIRAAKVTAETDRALADLAALRSTENSPEAKVLTLPGCKPRIVPTQRTGDEWFEALMDARDSDFGGAS